MSKPTSFSRFKLRNGKLLTDATMDEIERAADIYIAMGKASGPYQETDNPTTMLYPSSWMKTSPPKNRRV